MNPKQHKQQLLLDIMTILKCKEIDELEAFYAQLTPGTAQVSTPAKILTRKPRAIL